MPKTEQEAKQIGMDLAAEHNRESLVAFRGIARWLTMDEICIDDVRRVADAIRFQYVPSNWLGSVFKGDDWEWTGKVKASTHKGSHGRMVKIWKRREI